MSTVDSIYRNACTHSRHLLSTWSDITLENALITHCLDILYMHSVHHSYLFLEHENMFTLHESYNMELSRVLESKLAI